MRNTKVTSSISKNLLKLTFVFTFLFASSAIFTVAANTSLHTSNIVVENETMKMTIMQSEEGVNEATVAVYSASTEATIIVFNSVGMVVLEKIYSVKKDQKNSLALDLEGLKTGTYYVVHDESKGSVTYALTKES